MRRVALVVLLMAAGNLLAQVSTNSEWQRWASFATGVIVGSIIWSEWELSR
jgi:hypothetical protein